MWMCPVRSRLLPGQLGPGRGRQFGRVRSAAEEKGDLLDGAGERERSLVIVDHRRQGVAADVEPGGTEHANDPPYLDPRVLVAVNGNGQRAALAGAVESGREMVASGFEDERCAGAV